MRNVFRIRHHMNIRSPRRIRFASRFYGLRKSAPSSSGPPDPVFPVTRPPGRLTVARQRSTPPTRHPQPARRRPTLARRRPQPVSEHPHPVNRHPQPVRRRPRPTTRRPHPTTASARRAWARSCASTCATMAAMTTTWSRATADLTFLREVDADPESCSVSAVAVLCALRVLCSERLLNTHTCARHRPGGAGPPWRGPPQIRLPQQQSQRYAEVHRERGKKARATSVSWPSAAGRPPAR